MLLITIICALALVLSIDSAQAWRIIENNANELKGLNRNMAEQKLLYSLEKLASGDGPHYKLGQIHSVTSHTLGGLTYFYEVQLIEEEDMKRCRVEIWSRYWIKENGVSVTFNCPDGKVVKTYSA